MTRFARAAREWRKGGGGRNRIRRNMTEALVRSFRYPVHLSSDDIQAAVSIYKIATNGAPHWHVIDARVLGDYFSGRELSRKSSQKILAALNLAPPGTEMTRQLVGYIKEGRKSKKMMMIAIGDTTHGHLGHAVRRAVLCLLSKFDVCYICD